VFYREAKAQASERLSKKWLKLEYWRDCSKSKLFFLGENSCLECQSCVFIYQLCADQLETSTSPPRAYPGNLTVHRTRGGRNLNVELEGWGIWTGFISVLFWHNTPESYFRILQGLTDSQDRISPLLMNNSLKRVFKEVWRYHYGIFLSERRVKCLIEDEICLWGELVRY